MAQFHDHMCANIVSRRASLICRSRLGHYGAEQRLAIPEMYFGLSFRLAFNEQELAIMNTEYGLAVPTYDERGRLYNVQIRTEDGRWELNGEWHDLSVANVFRPRTIVSLWIYREPLQLGPIMKMPRLLVLAEREPFCSFCKRLSRFSLDLWEN